MTRYDAFTAKLSNAGSKGRRLSPRRRQKRNDNFHGFHKDRGAAHHR